MIFLAIVVCGLIALFIPMTWMWVAIVGLILTAGVIGEVLGDE